MKIKKVVPVIATLLYSFSVNGQTTQEAINNFKALLVEATTDFKNVKGTVLENDSSNKTVYYSCTKTLGSSFEAINVNSNDNTTYFASKFENGLRVKDELGEGYKVLQGVLNILKAMLKSGKYKGGQFTRDGKTIVEVKDLDGNYLVETELLAEPVGKETSYILITIFGKSWGKK